MHGTEVKETFYELILLNNYALICNVIYMFNFIDSVAIYIFNYHMFCLEMFKVTEL